MRKSLSGRGMDISSHGLELRKCDECLGLSPGYPQWTDKAVSPRGPRENLHNHEYAASNGERDFFSDVIQLRILTGEIILNVPDGPNLIT